LAVDEEELHSVQSKILAAVLQKYGISSKTPIPLRHGPLDMGGLDLPDLRTEMGIAQLKLLRNAVFAKTEVGKLILLSLKYSQIEAGISQPLMEHPEIPMSYISPTWLLSLRQYMYQHNLALTFSDQLHINYQGQYDRCIMQQAMLKRYSKQQQWDINLVRLHLQVMTLSDISTANGKQITQQAYNGTRKSQHRIRLNWPRQSKPTTHQIKIWRQYISTNFIRYGRQWIQGLGKIIPNTSRTKCQLQQSKESATPQCKPHQHATIKAYLRTLPKWHQRLLADSHQMTDDAIIWRAFRSKSRTIDIASDGGLSKGIGTFGWKMVTSHNNKVLFQGSGPIDGPHEVGSSTRSELGGFAAPLLLAASLAKYWGIRHRCEFHWLTDSTAAISKVKLYTTRSRYKPRKYPDHSDYVTTIMDLIKEL
jgi:hypothetical protein